MKGGAKVVVEPHRHEGVFLAKGKEDALCTLNSAPGKVGCSLPSFQMCRTTRQRSLPSLFIGHSISTCIDTQEVVGMATIRSVKDGRRGHENNDSASRVGVIIGSRCSPARSRKAMFRV